MAPQRRGASSQRSTSAPCLPQLQQGPRFLAVSHARSTLALCVVDRPLSGHTKSFQTVMNRKSVGGLMNCFWPGLVLACVWVQGLVGECGCDW